MLRNIAEQVGFGQLSPSDGGKQLVAEITQILARG